MCRLSEKECADSELPQTGRVEYIFGEKECAESDFMQKKYTRNKNAEEPDALNPGYPQEWTMWGSSTVL